MISSEVDIECVSLSVSAISLFISLKSKSYWAFVQPISFGWTIFVLCLCSLGVALLALPIGADLLLRCRQKLLSSFDDLSGT